jgi:DNA-binding PadR family transcriptional regulator
MAEMALREPAFLILTALAARPRHGYGLLEEVERLSEGQIRPRAGSLYALLDRLNRGGLIVVDREEVVQSRLRRYYRLTPTGTQRLAAESARIRRQADLAGRRLGTLGLTLDASTP